MKILCIPSPEQASAHLKKYLSSIHVESELCNIGADTIELRRLLSHKVNMQRLINNPVSLDDKDISDIISL